MSGAKTAGSSVRSVPPSFTASALSVASADSSLSVMVTVTSHLRDGHAVPSGWVSFTPPGVPGEFSSLTVSVSSGSSRSSSTIVSVTSLRAVNSVPVGVKSDGSAQTNTERAA